MRGIEVRHQRGCTAKRPIDCPCGPNYRATVYLDGQPIRRSFKNPLDAVDFRTNGHRAKVEGILTAPNTVALRVHWNALLDDIENGVIRDRKGRLYKASTVEGYRRSWNLYLDGPLGAYPAGDPGLREAIKRTWKAWLRQDRPGGAMAPNSIANNLMPLRVLFRHLIDEGIVRENPTTGMMLPAGEKKRDRVAEPVEFEALLAALPTSTLRVAFGLAGYTGMRMAEIRGLREEMIDWDAREIIVAGQWSPHSRAIMSTKTREDRTIPIPDALYTILGEHRRVRREKGIVSPLFVCNATGGAFTPGHLQRQADKAWHQAMLWRITFHELRHTYATYLIAAGLNPKAVSKLMGHSSIQITFDRYGHLFKGHVDEARGLLDTYLGKE